jgi:hypothetical protein
MMIGLARLRAPAAAVAACYCRRAASSSSASSAISRRLRLYYSLSKIRLSGLVAFSSAFGFLAAGSPLDFGGLAAVTAGTWLTAASAATFNQLAEVCQADVLLSAIATQCPTIMRSASVFVSQGLSRQWVPPLPIL